MGSTMWLLSCFAVISGSYEARGELLGQNGEKLQFIEYWRSNGTYALSIFQADELLARAAVNGCAECTVTLRSGHSAGCEARYLIRESPIRKLLPHIHEVRSNQHSSDNVVLQKDGSVRVSGGEGVGQARDTWWATIRFDVSSPGSLAEKAPEVESASQKIVEQFRSLRHGFWVPSVFGCLGGAVPGFETSIDDNGKLEITDVYACTSASDAKLAPGQAVRVLDPKGVSGEYSPCGRLHENVVVELLSGPLRGDSVYIDRDLEQQASVYLGSGSSSAASNVRLRFNDPHSEDSPESAEMAACDYVDGNHLGLVVEGKSEKPCDELSVKHVCNNTLASELGLRQGDVILAVGEQCPTLQRIDEFVKKCCQEGASLRVRRHGIKRAINIDCESKACAPSRRR